MVFLTIFEISSQFSEKIEFSKLRTNLSINENQTFSSDSWFGAPKDPMLIEI